MYHKWSKHQQLKNTSGNKVVNFILAFQVLGNILMKANNSTIAESPSKKKKKAAGKSPDDKADSATQARECLAYLLDCTTGEGIPHHAQKYLLGLIDQVDSEVSLGVFSLFVVCSCLGKLHFYHEAMFYGLYINVSGQLLTRTIPHHIGICPDEWFH